MSTIAKNSLSGRSPRTALCLQIRLGGCSLPLILTTTRLVVHQRLIVYTNILAPNDNTNTKEENIMRGRHYPPRDSRGALPLTSTRRGLIMDYLTSHVWNIV